LAASPAYVYVASPARYTIAWCRSGVRSPSGAIDRRAKQINRRVPGAVCGSAVYTWAVDISIIIGRCVAIA
jgi:hypothetical protein